MSKTGSDVLIPMCGKVVIGRLSVTMLRDGISQDASLIASAMVPRLAMWNPDLAASLTTWPLSRVYDTDDNVETYTAYAVIVVKPATAWRFRCKNIERSVPVFRERQLRARAEKGDSDERTLEKSEAELGTIAPRPSISLADVNMSTFE
ncbi:hypothetical protein H4582DRAFT_2060053 [Lactarius indigo]|nr:hypothetical protein H4582DRAFT_2060053 [Lactarius indigo]